LAVRPAFTINRWKALLNAPENGALPWSLAANGNGGSSGLPGVIFDRAISNGAAMGRTNHYHCRPKSTRPFGRPARQAISLFATAHFAGLGLTVSAINQGKLERIRASQAVSGNKQFGFRVRNSLSDTVHRVVFNTSRPRQWSS
jgi:hypothetical protein